MTRCPCCSPCTPISNRNQSRVDERGRTRRARHAPTPLPSQGRAHGGMRACRPPHAHIRQVRRGARRKPARTRLHSNTQTPQSPANISLPFSRARRRRGGGGSAGGGEGEGEGMPPDSACVVLGTVGAGSRRSGTGWRSRLGEVGLASARRLLAVPRVSHRLSGVRGGRRRAAASSTRQCPTRKATAVQVGIGNACPRQMKPQVRAQPLTNGRNGAGVALCAPGQVPHPAALKGFTKQTGPQWGGAE